MVTNVIPFPIIQALRYFACHASVELSFDANIPLLVIDSLFFLHFFIKFLAYLGFWQSFSEHISSQGLLIMNRHLICLVNDYHKLKVRIVSWSGLPPPHESAIVCSQFVVCNFACEIRGGKRQGATTLCNFPPVCLCIVTIWWHISLY